MNFIHWSEWLTLAFAASVVVALLDDSLLRLGFPGRLRVATIVVFAATVAAAACFLKGMLP